MKSLVIIFLVLFLLLSCGQKHSQASSGAIMQEEADEDTLLPKATAIFWIDKNKNRTASNKERLTHARNVKVQVDIDSTGKVKILSYAKPQEKEVRKYLQDKLRRFQVTKIMMDSGFVKPGVQYVQLRYVPRKMLEH